MASPSRPRRDQRLRLRDLLGQHFRANRLGRTQSFRFAIARCGCARRPIAARRIVRGRRRPGSSSRCRSDTPTGGAAGGGEVVGVQARRPAPESLAAARDERRQQGHGNCRRDRRVNELGSPSLIVLADRLRHGAHAEAQVVTPVLVGGKSLPMFQSSMTFTGPRGDGHAERRR